jgi:WD40 repeat protein
MRSSVPPFQRYRLGQELGRGGMGRVVEAFDTQLGRTVALKEVLPNRAGVNRRFAREVQITARLEHPAIVPLYDSGTTPDGRPFYVMRKVTGRPLDEMIKRATNLGDRLALLPHVLAAIDAVAHAHRRGVIHRDLKPANILVGELGETVVIDWGLAKVIGEEDVDDDSPAAKLLVPADSLHTQIGTVFGTPGFMPPEQARGEELGTRGDVYALGATLYQLLAGAPPHAGTSATEVLGKTLKHDVAPLEESAPGAPPELVAIVEKALAFEAETRYPNAGALGEDVRRFTTGQLVAAHRYTRRQRVGRFARKHQAALIIAAAGSVALAVLAWISVSRVMHERDTAHTAQREAELDKIAAERARDRLAERNDALIVTQARALLDTNPTEALATLKQLDPKSSRMAEAKAVAQAAVMRGAWFAIRSTDDLTTYVELGVDGKYLMQLSRDGDAELVRIWDLDRRRLAVTHPYARGYRLTWLAGNKLLAYDDTHVPEVLDPMTNQVVATTLPPLDDVTPDAQGKKLVALDAQKHAMLWDVDSRAAKPLWNGHAVSSVAIAPDGSWLALADAKGLVILDADGKELGARTGQTTRVVASDHRQVAVLDDRKVLIANVGGPWTELPLGRGPNERVIDLAYRGDELDMFVTTGDLLGYRSALYTAKSGIRQFSYRLTSAGDHVMIVPSGDGKLYLTGDQLDLPLPLPTAVQNLRLAARPGVSRFAVVGTGVVMTFDLDAVVPRRIAAQPGTDAIFVDDDTLLAWRSVDQEWRWIDLRTGAETTLPYDLRGIPSVVDADPIAGRVLVREDMGPATRLVLLNKNKTTRTVLGSGGPQPWGRLVPGNAIILGPGDGRVLARIGDDEEPHEVVKLDGHAIAAVGLGPLSFAAVSDRGELVRGNLANGAIERANVAPGGTVFIASDLLGRVLIGEDNRLSLWDRDRIVLLQKYDRTIARIDPTETGVMVTLVDHELQLLDPTGAEPARRLFAPSVRPPQSQPSGRLAIGTGNGEQLIVVELPSAARWNVPMLFVSTGMLGLAPNARRVLQTGGGSLIVWELPQAGSDFAAWLDDQTNAIVRDDLLTWPWQTKP